MNWMNSKFDICIVGGGAAGLVAAITVARLGKSVCVLDSNKMLGKKLLSTGNGRCNYTNSNMDSSFFYSSFTQKDIYIEKVLSSFSYLDTITFFESIGIKGTSINGYYYPYTNQATSIRDALEREIKALGVSVLCDRRVTDINIVSDKFNVKAYGVDLTANKVIIATGGMVGDKLGCVGDGYSFATSMKHKICPVFPGLTALKFDDSDLSTLAGVRCYGKILDQIGEIQWNKDNISGIPILCVSRLISKDLMNSKDISIAVDLLPDVSYENLLDMVIDRTSKYSNLSIKEALLGIINDKCLDFCLLKNRIDQAKACYEMSLSELEKICSLIKKIDISVIGTKDFNSSQVTAGGVSLTDVDPATMESKKAPGLYFAGEVLDVDGICGGYNLQWAFSTGVVAARSACDV